MSYAVVKFLTEDQHDEEVVSEVPMSWISKDNKCCKWPPGHASIYIAKNVPPNSDWEDHPIELEFICGEALLKD